MSAEDYWKECIEIAFEEEGILATDEQIENVAGAVESCHENYGLAFYQPPDGEHLSQENDRLRRELKKEQDKIICPECKGGGSLTTNGPIHSSTSECHKCRGDGRISL